MKQRDSVTIRFEGDSGDGIISMGKLAARVAARMGYHVYTYSTFLAVVRGGQVTFQLRLGSEPLLSQGNEPEILVALNRQAVRDNGMQVQAGGVILHPPLNGSPEPVNGEANSVAVNYEEISIQETGRPRSKNMVAVGALLGMLGLGEEMAREVVRGMFEDKGKDVAESNIHALEAGFSEGRRIGGLAERLRVAPPADAHPRLLLSGNEAVAFGALAAGVRFYAGYPITPASEIMEWLAKYLPRVNGTMIQAEDEISALGMCIGASFGGVKAMTATSGPGLSLMIELLGLASMAEIPIVIADVQRAGPSTGMPTKEAQGDLVLAAHGNHGEAPRVVLAPQTVADCFEQTIRAVNIAHQFHIPVILLSSQSLSHRMQTIEPPDVEHMDIYHEPLFEPGMLAEGEDFHRFAQTPDGRPSIRSIPGVEGGMYRAGGLEHDETGSPNFAPAVRQAMVKRRRERMHAIEREFSDKVASDAYFASASPIGLMSWGSTASTTREVINSLREKGLDLSYLLPRILWPLPDRAIERFLAGGVRTLFVCELNATRQFAEMLRARYTAELIRRGIEVISITKDDGLPFTPGEIERQILAALETRGISAGTPQAEACKK